MGRTRKAYRAVFEHAGDDGWWTVTIPDVPGCISQGRSIAQARERIREALGLFVDEAESATIEDEIRLPTNVRKLVRRYNEASKRAEQAQAVVSEQSREAARALQSLGLSTRDSGEALRISQTRVAQLLREPESKSKKGVASKRSHTRRVSAKG